jgi:hypothetical protein
MEILNNETSADAIIVSTKFWGCCVYQGLSKNDQHPCFVLLILLMDPVTSKSQSQILFVSLMLVNLQSPLATLLSMVRRAII